MSVTRQVPARDGGSGRGPEARREGRYVMPFDAFLRWLSVGARVRNDTAWLEWYAEWLKNMPEDGREEYMERSKADYEARMGETVGEYMDRMHNETIAENIEANTAENIEANTAENIEANTAESIAECTRLNIEEATNHQIMVENFKIFRREYTDMITRRSC